MAQRKRAGLITRRALDRNQLMLEYFLGSSSSFSFSTHVILASLLSNQIRDF